MSGFNIRSIFNGDFLNFLTAEYDNGELYTAGNRSFDRNEIKSVDIDWISGSVDVFESDKDTVSLIEDTNAESDELKVHSLLMDGTLYVKFMKSSVRKGSSDLKEIRKNLTVEIPTGIKLTVNTVSADIKCDRLSCLECYIKSTSGNVRLDSLDSTGAVCLTTTSGDISAKNIIAGDDIKLEAVSGDIKLDGCFAQKGGFNYLLKVKNVSGDTKIEEIFAEKATFNSVSGDIKLGMVDCKSVSAETVSGSAYIRLPEGKGFNAKLSSVSGKIDTPIGSSGRKGSLVSGDGEISVSMNSVSGMLVIK